MATNNIISQGIDSTRREFLITLSLFAAAPTVLAATSTAVAAVHPGGSDFSRWAHWVRRCAVQEQHSTLRKQTRSAADRDGNVFEDRLVSSLETLQGND